jgi:alpha-1,2-mannosyltransferase
MAVLLILLSLLFIVIVDVLFLSQILRFFAGLLGHYLRRSSRTRRELLLARVANETRSFKASGKSRANEGLQLDEAAPGSTSSDWKGIVGFFHPFWYVVRCGLR